MNSVLELLDDEPSRSAAPELRRAWVADLERSFVTDSAQWLAGVGLPARPALLSEDRAWRLLDWVEDMASLVVVKARPGLVENAAFALSLLEASPLDRRDVMVVAALVRRGSDLAGLEFSDPVRGGCERAGALGQQCLQWLGRVSQRTPPTYEEVGAGATFRFRYKTSDDQPSSDAGSPSDAAVGQPDGAFQPPRGRAGRSAPVDRATNGDVAPWPFWLRFTILAVLFGVAGVGLVSALYSRGILPIAGPFAVIFLSPLLLLLQISGRGFRRGRLVRRTVVQLTTLAPAIERERRLLPQARASGATDRSLTEAAEQVQSALQRLAWGQETIAGASIDGLVRTAESSWSPAASLSTDAAQVAKTARRLQKVLEEPVRAPRP